MLPGWLAAGLAIAGLLAAVFAVLFVAGEWLFPTERAAAGGGEGHGDRKRRAEMRAYLAAIGEPFREDHPLEGETVAFYLPERDVAVTFDPRVYFRVEGTHTVLAEHEMPGGALGGRLPFDVPPVGEAGRQVSGGDDRAGRSVREAFGTLGLEPGASTEEVRRAYRERIKAAHPDHGGDEERFRRLREAYTTAANHAG